MTLWSIDPGTAQSALVVFDGSAVIEHWLAPNHTILAQLRRSQSDDVLVLEQMAGMGMAVGQEVFETCVWTGRFWEAWPGIHVDRIKRLPIKLHLCGTARAKDANVRQALLDRFGGKAQAIGSKARQGPLYGLHGDEWAALALAVTWWEQQRGPVARDLAPVGALAL